uniref:Uncharacterized protein n=1 Tax=Anser cygnoides TaxID=8845 RepID=A0A8B9EG84_ANSCY
GARGAAGDGDPAGVGTGGVLGRGPRVLGAPGAGVTKGAGVTGAAPGDTTPLPVPSVSVCPRVRRVALTGRVPPGHGGDTGDVAPPCTVRIRRDVLLPVEIPKVLAMAKEPPEAPAPMPVEEPRQVMPRGSCLIHNWQEERATNDLDRVLAPETGSEGFVHRHGHRGLLARQPPAQPPPSTTSKHAFRPPHSIPMLARGQREAMLELMLYQKQELLEETCPPRAPMERLSTTHRDFQYPQPALPAGTAPPAHGGPRVPPLQGVTCIRTGDSPFRRNAAFSTPIAEYLEQPLPHVAERYGVRPSKQ